jgi:coenzyme PQQ precursor peptide PqqA
MLWWSWYIRLLKERFFMEWTTPQHEEIDLNCEVNSYANAEL